MAYYFALILGGLASPMSGDARVRSTQTGTSIAHFAAAGRNSANRHTTDHAVRLLRSSMATNSGSNTSR